LPIGWSDEVIREKSYRIQSLTPVEAKRVAIQQTRLHFLKNLSNERKNNAIIRKQQTLVQKTSKTYLEMRVFFEVEQEIGEYAEVEPVEPPIKPEKK
jgi:hypothetical protein